LRRRPNTVAAVRTRLRDRGVESSCVQRSRSGCPTRSPLRPQAARATAGRPTTLLDIPGRLRGPSPHPIPQLSGPGPGASLSDSVQRTHLPCDPTTGPGPTVSSAEPVLEAEVRETDSGVLAIFAVQLLRDPDEDGGRAGAFRLSTFRCPFSSCSEDSNGPDPRVFGAERASRRYLGS
jgi:hypothetical protein